MLQFQNNTHTETDARWRLLLLYIITLKTVSQSSLEKMNLNL